MLLLHVVSNLESIGKRHSARFLFRMSTLLLAMGMYIKPAKLFVHCISLYVQCITVIVEVLVSGQQPRSGDSSAVLR